MKIGNIPHSEPIEGLLAKPAPRVVQPALPVFYAYASTQEENSSGEFERHVWRPIVLDRSFVSAR